VFLPAERLEWHDARFRTANGTFYKPLPFPASGNLRFVLVGGPMHYIDRRGEYSCDSSSPGTLADDVSRVAALVDDPAWTTTVVELTSQLLGIEERSNPDAYAFSIGFVNAPFREAVKALGGRYPKKQVWANHPPLKKPGRGRWLYDSGPPRFVFHCVRGQELIPVAVSPSVVLWRWPDRSDLMLQALCETLSRRGSYPSTVVLPDVPALRDFARRYNRCERMDRVRRALLEQQLYFELEKPNKRGAVVYGRFGPRLVIDSDGTEWDGKLLSAAISYLETHYRLRLRPWELFHEPLFRQLLEKRAQESEPDTSLEWSPTEIVERQRMLDWYRPEHENPGAMNAVLFRDRPPKQRSGGDK